jgi:ADP-ribose pyrophosphatase YjhB (NUDIX family)
MMEKPYGLTMRGIIKNNDGKILVLRRHPKLKTNPHKWELPGGKIEKCEFFDEALIREKCERLAAQKDKFTMYIIGFSLYERLWTLHGIIESLIDYFYRFFKCTLIRGSKNA